MSRPIDHERKLQLLDELIVHVGRSGLNDIRLRPLSSAVGLSLNGLVHHVGNKEDLVYRLLQRSIAHQHSARTQWLKRTPRLSQADLFRRWWRWLQASPLHFAIARLAVEVPTRHCAPGGLADTVGVDRVAHWRFGIRDRLVSEGVSVDVAKVEADLVQAMFTGLVIELISGMNRRPAGRALEIGLARLEQVVWTNAGLSEPFTPAGLDIRNRRAPTARERM